MLIFLGGNFTVEHYISELDHDLPNPKEGYQ